MQDAADHPPVICAFLAAHVGRKQGRDASPLLVAQPEQVAPHLLCSFASQRISNRFQPQQIYWVSTLVGDVHQPLHAAARFTSEHADGDQGGNLVAVECGQGCSSIKNLHAFWDGVMGSNNSVEAAREATARLPKVDAAKAAIADEAVWIAESVALAQSVVYLDIPADTHGAPVRLSAEYKAAARSAAEQQIALAGARLALLLYQAFR
jgi:hypothetical protein